MKIYRGNRKIVHKRKKPTSMSFFLGNFIIEIIDKYKYLGIFLEEFLDYKCTASMLSGAAVELWMVSFLILCHLNIYDLKPLSN